jgi:hypothetical protein
MENKIPVDWLIEEIKSDTLSDSFYGVQHWDKDTLLGFLEKAKAIENEHMYYLKEFWYGRGIAAMRENRIKELQPKRNHNDESTSE